MIRETFGLESETTGATTSDGNDIFAQTLDAVLERSLLPIADRLSAYLRLILMQVLPRQLQIELKRQFQTTYQDLTEIFPRRSYFSMIWVQPHNTVWFMHLDRSLAEGLAGRKYNLEFGSSGKRWHEVQPRRIQEFTSRSVKSTTLLPRNPQIMGAKKAV